MSSEAEDEAGKAEYRRRHPYVAVPGQIHWATNMLPTQRDCCDDLAQDVVKMTADALVALIDGKNQMFARPTELGTNWMAGSNEVNERLCQHEILKRVPVGKDGCYYKFTVFTKAWCHYMSSKLSTKTTPNKQE